MMFNRNKQVENETADLLKKLKNLQFITTIMSICIICLLILIILISKIRNNTSKGPLLSTEKNAYAFGVIYKYENTRSYTSHKMGRISITSDGSLGETQSSSSVFLKGIITELNPGSSHGLLLVENTNFLQNSDGSDDIFHFNPTGSLYHKCKNDQYPSSTSHMGDLGDVVANEKGEAMIDKYISEFHLNLVYGRAILVLKTEDNCNNENFYVNKTDILGYAVLGIYSEDQEEIQLKTEQVEKNNRQLMRSYANFKEKKHELGIDTSNNTINFMNQSFEYLNETKSSERNDENIIKTKNIFENNLENVTLTKENYFGDSNKDKDYFPKDDSIFENEKSASPIEIFSQNNKFKNESIFPELAVFPKENDLNNFDENMEIKNNPKPIKKKEKFQNPIDSTPQAKNQDFSSFFNNLINDDVEFEKPEKTQIIKENQNNYDLRENKNWKNGKKLTKSQSRSLY